MVLASSSLKVMGEACNVISRDVNGVYGASSFLRNEERSNKLWEEVQFQSQKARNDNEKLNFDVSGEEDDIFGAAKVKSEAARLNVEKHDNVVPSKDDKNINSNSGIIINNPKRPTLNKNSNLDNVREYSTSSNGRDKNDDYDASNNNQSNNSTKIQMTSSSVPSSRLERLFHYGALAAGVGIGMAQQSLKHYAAGTKPESAQSLILSPKNIERMAKKFSRMRGAALKIGQLLSFQDSTVLPPGIREVLLRVQNSAHYMLPGQLEKVMRDQLGDNWRSNYFASFQDVPIAAASIGQVHRAVTKNLEPVVIKVQYPGVADSIDSDLSNLALLLTASRILPAGLFLDKTIDNARLELKWECDYIREAQSLIRFRELLKDDDVFKVPKVYNELSGQHVLTMEEMKGTEVIKGNWNQDTANWIATQIMRLSLTEIAKFKFMQTDPNWANFLYNEKTNKIELLDFGATRDYGDEFIKNYLNCLRASILKDRDLVELYSKKLGYLTGLESAAMTQAHIDSILVLGEPFSPADNHGKNFDFGNQTVTDRVRSNIGTMLNERLTPPPEETYSLHRKLSGVYLLCARLKAKIPGEQIFKDVIGTEIQ
ncbi:hypothetical protein PACTADRAFT_51220 [Pachysolen tannophilus NRRL Y-2460]|uniref:ABC1 atypical kinase-like domain-containing protein n=1 Tax=Pachysolen tannophilus NRRL Y-2460 TaxID=669874 RepID=A0A1E4TRI4_PACTA|nr:hypothetical protein PACTADRAFT_51220 [Pachysolen tannophilus NRRL Y-2460]